ncbi:transposase [Aureimonas leprariae]|uniref:Transposase n=1 Tax=Plantimonas leprariae TaxID=2615207 RepID=A0A7V7TYN7_9HYPH|nr:transposase [Aureimonas leprariae]
MFEAVAAAGEVPNELSLDSTHVKAHRSAAGGKGGKARRIKAVIPSTATRTKPFPLDRRAYKRRNRIERLFRRLKNWRRIATRYERLARNYLAALALVSSTIAWT